MRIIRYEDPSGKIHFASQQGGSHLRIEGNPFDGFRVTSDAAQICRVLAPVAPAMIWCIGQNYRRHADEVGMGVTEYPVVFAKGPNTVQDPSEPIRIPVGANRTQSGLAGKLVAGNGKKCKRRSPRQALDYLGGQHRRNDVSGRDWQLKMGGSQWCRGKSFDTFAPIGPCLATPDSIGDPGKLHIQTVVNGQTMQDANTRDMIHDVPALIAFLSQSTTLLPGTLIFTGTPSGVGMAQVPPLWIKDGDEVSVTIEGIGTLTNRVCGAPS